MRSLILVLIFVSFLLPTVVHAQSLLATPVTLSFNNVTFAYYQSQVHPTWVVVFLPGGIGSPERLLGCNNIVQLTDPNSGERMHFCYPIASKHFWLADQYMSAGFDYVEVLAYQFTFGTHSWLTSFLQYVKYGLGYSHVLLAGFSAGAAVTADLIAWGGVTMQGIVDAAAIYEGTTTGRGVLGSAYIAYNVTVPVFLVYGNHDEPLSPAFPGVPATNGQQYAKNMNPNVHHQLVIVESGHDESVITETLPELTDFLLNT